MDGSSGLAMLLAGLDVLEVLHANMNRHALAMINDFADSHRQVDPI